MERPSSAVLHVITTFAPSSANNLHAEAPIPPDLKPLDQRA